MTGNYAPFIIGSYAMTAIAVLVLIAWVIIDHHRQLNLLRDLEARGVSRRSSRADTVASDAS